MRADSRHLVIRGDSSVPKMALAFNRKVIIIARLLYYLHDGVAQISRMQRIYV